MSAKAGKQKVGAFEFKVTNKRKDDTDKPESVGSKRGRTAAHSDDEVSHGNAAKKPAPLTFTYPDVTLPTVSAAGEELPAPARLRLLYNIMAPLHIEALKSSLQGEDAAIFAIAEKLIASFSFVAQGEKEPKLEANPKNVTHKAEMDQLQENVNRMEDEMSQWTRVQNKYIEKAESSSTFATDAVPNASDLALPVPESKEEQEIYEKYKFVQELDQTMSEILPDVFFDIDTIAATLRATGQRIDDAASMTRTLSKAIREVTFASLDVAEPRKVLKQVIATGEAPSNADEALKQIADSVVAEVGSESFNNFSKLSTATDAQHPSKTPTKDLSAKQSTFPAHRAAHATPFFSATPGDILQGRPSVPFDTPAIIKKITAGKRP